MIANFEGLSESTDSDGGDYNCLHAKSRVLVLGGKQLLFNAVHFPHKLKENEKIAAIEQFFDMNLKDAEMKGIKNSITAGDFIISPKKLKQWLGPEFSLGIESSETKTTQKRIRNGRSIDNIALSGPDVDFVKPATVGFHPAFSHGVVKAIVRVKIPNTTTNQPTNSQQPTNQPTTVEPATGPHRKSRKNVRFVDSDSSDSFKEAQSKRKK